MKKTRPFLRRPSESGCVKTRLSHGRAELFSQLPSPNRSCQCNRFSTTTKSRRKFYAQVQRRSFHTAWFAATTSGMARAMRSLSHPPVVDPVLPRQHVLCAHRLDDEVARISRRAREVIDSPVAPRGVLNT